MSLTCKNCNSVMPDGSCFCSVCGKKLHTDESVEDLNKKRLIDEIILRDIKKQKNSFRHYVGGIVLIVAIIVLFSLGAYMIILCIFPCVISLIKSISYDLRRVNPKFYIIERVCLSKNIVENDGSPDSYRIWFENASKQLLVAVDVEKGFFDQTCLGEEFYLVFLIKEKTPCLSFRKSEWVR